MNPEIKSRIVHNLQKEHKLSKILSVLELPRSTYRYWVPLLDRPNKDQLYIDLIHEIRKTHKKAGIKPLTKMINDMGYKVNRKRIERICRENDLSIKDFSKRINKFSTFKGNNHNTCKDHIKRCFIPEVPYQKITTDTSQFKYYEQSEKGRVTKHLYLNPICDMFSGEIISYSISRKPDSSGFIKAAKKAIRITAQCEQQRIFHSDQGAIYHSDIYCKLLRKNNIIQSMSRKGNCLDNAMMESFFAILKREVYFDQEFNSYEELKQTIEEYIKYYNEQRIRERLGYMSPVKYREKYFQNLKQNTTQEKI